MVESLRCFSIVGHTKFHPMDWVPEVACVGRTGKVPVRALVFMCEEKTLLKMETRPHS